MNKEDRSKIKVIGVSGLAIIIVALIILVMRIDNTPHYEDNDSANTTVVEEYIDLSGVVAPINSDISEIKVVSNEDNEQADLMLGTVGLDLNDLTSYAASIDAKHDSSHAIVVTKPKQGSYAVCKKALIDYISDKQRILLDSNKENSEEYNNALSAIVYEHDEYLILVMEDNADTILDEIVTQLDSSKQD